MHKAFVEAALRNIVAVRKVIAETLDADDRVLETKIVRLPDEKWLNVILNEKYYKACGKELYGEIYKASKQVDPFILRNMEGWVLY